MRKALYTLLFSCLTISLFGCGGSVENKEKLKETQKTEISDSSEKEEKEFYTFEEFNEIIKNARYIYNQNSEYLTDEEKLNKKDEIFKKIKAETGLNNGQRVKVRGYFAKINDYDQIVLASESDSENEDYIGGIDFSMREFLKEFLCFERGDLLEIECDFKYPSELVNCEVTTGLPKFKYKNNVDEIYSKIFIEEGLIGEIFCLMGEISEVNYMGDWYDDVDDDEFESVFGFSIDEVENDYLLTITDDSNERTAYAFVDEVEGFPMSGKVVIYGEWETKDYSTGIAICRNIKHVFRAE